MANILALETSTDICSVSVNNDREFLHFHEALPRQHSEKLLGIISDLINQVNLTFEDLDSIAVAVGPGSYTGLRLSCAIAQGLAYAQKIDVVSLSSLELLSLEAHEKTGFDEIISLSSSNQGKVYTAKSRFIKGDVDTEFLLLDENELKNKIFKQNSKFVGQGCELLQVQNILPNAEPKASLLMKIAQLRFRKGKTIKPEFASPMYFNDEDSWKKIT